MVDCMVDNNTNIENDTNIEIDFIPTANLKGRYGINRSALYKRFEAASVKPVKLSSRNKTFISQEQLQLLDELDQHIKDGGTLSEFNPNGRLQAMEVHQNTGYLEKTQPIFTELEPPITGSEAIVAELARISFQLEKRDDIDLLRQLQEIADNGWLINTTQLKGLIDVTPKGKEFTRGSFRFSKSGKIGAQSAWKVERVDG